MKEQKKSLKRNLKLLQNINPALAYQLTMVDPADLEFYHTPRNELNLRRFEKGKQYDYHSPTSRTKKLGNGSNHSICIELQSFSSTVLALAITTKQLNHG